LALCTTASAKVGVTSATDGDPLGKPPTENERVLRVGLDVQANEVVTTNAKDRAHLVFLDGTSITVGPNARLTLDKFVYDPNSKTGELALTATKGIFRVVGGRISKTNAITVTTPSSTIGIRGGISSLNVISTRTGAAFWFGTSLTVSAGGQTRTIVRPGFEIVTNLGGFPGAAFAVPRGALAGDFGALEGTSPGNTDADQQAQSSGFSGQNSGQGPGPGFTLPPPGVPNGVSNVANNAVSNSGVQQQPKSDQTTPTQTSTTTTTPTSARTSRTVNGYAAGLITNSNGESSQTRTPVLGPPTDLSITTDASTPQIAGTDTGTLIIRQFNNSVNTLQLGGTPATGVFADDKTYVMVTTDDPARPSTIKVGSQTFTTTDSTALVANGPPGITSACTCDYLTWGLWATAIAYGAGPRNNQTDTVTLAPFVAGTLTPMVQMPQTGSATYSGAMAGVAQANNGTPYSAIGTYNSTWGFASRTGAFNASFDGTNYTGSAAAVPGSNGATFAGTFAGGNRNGSLSGAFFAAPGDVAKYQAGAFAINGPGQTYKAAGVFAGQRP